MAIGSLGRAGRIEQLQTFARCQVWSGYRSPDEVRAEVREAVLDEVGDELQADELTEDLVRSANESLDDLARGLAGEPSFERLQRAFASLRADGVVVLEAVDDHWAAAETLERLRAASTPPLGIVYFTHPDVWHCVEHGMLELNVWHGSTANVAPGDALLDLVLRRLADQAIPAVFDEGRIEATLPWQRC